MTDKTKSKSAFTLAEVLITLVIIGVVAALTIPTAINRIQREELRSQFKKQVSVMSQAIQKMKVDYGDLVYDMDNDTELTFREKFMRYFSVSCSENCLDVTKYKNFSDYRWGSYEFFAYAFIAQDGVSYFFHKGSPSKLMYVTVDINGLGKKPNRQGYDVFTFYIQNSKLVPDRVGYPSGAFECSYSKLSNYHGGDGLGCTSRAIYDKDYFKNLP